MSKKALLPEAIRLRTEQRLSLPEISTALGVSKATLSVWLRSYPLPDEDLLQRRRENAPESSKKPRGKESTIHRKVVDFGVDQTTTWKGRVAEAAVLYRLVALGFEPLRAVFEGDSTDWFVKTPRKILYLQVRWAWTPSEGLPMMDVRRKGKGKQKFTEGQVDFFVGYVLYTDTTYVFSWDEVKDYQSSISVRPDAAERWDKLLGLTDLTQES